MSVNIRSQNKETTSNNNELNTNSISKSINSIQLRYFNKNINSKRYSNSSNKNNVHSEREEDEELDKLNNIYLTKEREYNNLVNHYKEIVDCLSQKKDFLEQNKSKYQSLIINNNNMKFLLLKLIKLKPDKLLFINNNNNNK